MEGYRESLKIINARIAVALNNISRDKEIMKEDNEKLKENLEKKMANIEMNNNDIKEHQKFIEK